MRFLIFLTIAVLIFAIFGTFNAAEAYWVPPDIGEPPPKEPCKPKPPVCRDGEVSAPFRCGDFAVYKCSNNACGKAGGAMEQGVEWYTCQTTTLDCSDECENWTKDRTDYIDGPHGPEKIKPFGKVNDYQICPAAYNDWGTTPPSPACSGSCYPPPNLRALDDASLSPGNVSENSKYKLPINFGWEDNVENEVIKAPNFCAVGSYEFNIVNPPLSEIVTDTQLQVPENEAYKLECQLKSDADYQWRARACLDSGGTDCGEWPESQSFDTNLAPELVSPYDPDWQGQEGAENATLPANPDWCDVGEANSFLLRVYVMESGDKICHPNLLAMREGREFCDPWIIRKERRDIEQPDKTLFSDLPDEDMYFFTRDAAYFWDVATCLDDGGLNCRDFSQQWMFTTGRDELPETFLVAPPNDPSGQKPVGLPLVLDWRKDAGINSWKYKIGSKQGSANVSQSRSFDYPELSLNTFYQWQVLSCTDYKAEKCQDSWSETYTFKTTGQPPGPIYPAPGAIDIVIPVNLDWQDAGGAESYILKVWGDGLNFEKTVNKSEFSLDYPDLKMLKNYSWQVKTCARDNGQVCGDYGAPQNFRTFQISPPLNPLYPQNGGMLFADEHFLSWEEVAGSKAYQYEVKLLSLAPEEQNQECSMPPLQTALANSGYVELGCLGQYQWQTKTCLDAQCQETSSWSSPWTFTFLEGGTGSGGLVPCGRATNNPNTSWNEREPCQIEHLFLSIKIILDFLLLRVIPIILVLLTIATGVIFYTSFGQIITMAQAMSLWKSAGIGLALIALAWTIVNLFLRLTNIIV